MRPDTSLLKYCRSKNSEEALKYVTEEPSYVSYDGKTALILACINGLQEVALELLKSEESIPNHIDDNNGTALSYACENEMYEVIVELMKYDSVNLDHVDCNENTPLTLCCSSRNEELEEIAIQLIESGKCNLAHKDELNQTPLMIAITSEFIELSKKLISSGEAEISYVDEQGNTALILACENSLDEIALLLLEEEDCNVDAIDENTDSALSIACYNDLSTVCTKILSICTSDSEYINAIDTMGKTPLIWLCKYGNIEALNILFENHIDVLDITINDDKDNNALHYSVKNSKLDDISCRMIDINPNLLLKPNQRGETPFNVICTNDKTVLIDKIINKINYEEYIPVLLQHKMYKKVMELLKENESPIRKFVLDLLNCTDLISLLDILLDKDKIKELNIKLDSVKEGSHDCLICFNSTYLCYLIQPCRHILTIDFNCISRLSQCPICRKEIEEKFQVYLT